MVASASHRGGAKWISTDAWGWMEIYTGFRNHYFAVLSSSVGTGAWGDWVGWERALEKVPKPTRWEIPNSEIERLRRAAGSMGIAN